MVPYTITTCSPNRACLAATAKCLLSFKLQQQQVSARLLDFLKNFTRLPLRGGPELSRPNFKKAMASATTTGAAEAATDAVDLAPEPMQGMIPKLPTMPEGMIPKMPEAPAGQAACVDNDAGVKDFSGGKAADCPAAAVASLCEDRQSGATVKEMCPKACGACGTTARSPSHSPFELKDPIMCRNPHNSDPGAAMQTTCMDAD